MRQRLNDNPMFALAFVGVLGIAIAFLFVTRMSGSSAQETAAPAATTPTTATTAAVTPPASTTPASTPGTSVAPTDPTSPAPAGDGFVAGPGLPKPVVTAYHDGDTVVLLVFKRNGIDDREVRRYVNQLSRKQDTAIFQTSAKNITDYSRIAVGVDLNRVPAIVVVEPSKKSKGGASPQATVTYGFHGVGSIEQAIRDAKYTGPEDLPTYPR